MGKGGRDAKTRALAAAVAPLGFAKITARKRARLPVPSQPPGSEDLHYARLASNRLRLNYELMHVATSKGEALSDITYNRLRQLGEVGRSYLDVRADAPKVVYTKAVRELKSSLVHLDTRTTRRLSGRPGSRCTQTTVCVQEVDSVAKLLPFVGLWLSHAVATTAFTQDLDHRAKRTENAYIGDFVEFLARAYLGVARPAWELLYIHRRAASEHGFDAVYRERLLDRRERYWVAEFGSVPSLLPASKSGLRDGQLTSDAIAATLARADSELSLVDREKVADHFYKRFPKAGKPLDTGALKTVVVLVGDHTKAANVLTFPDGAFQLALPTVKVSKETARSVGQKRRLGQDNTTPYVADEVHLLRLPYEGPLDFHQEVPTSLRGFVVDLMHLKTYAEVAIHREASENK